jgi:hypothetical protein
MRLREWAFGQVYVVDKDPINPAFTGATNNMYVVRPVTTEKTSEPTRVTIKFFARTLGGKGGNLAYVYLHDPTEPNAFTPVEKIQMQVEVQERKSISGNVSLTTLKGITFAVNAHDTKSSYKMGKDTTKVHPKASNPLDLFASTPSGVNHVVVSSHGGHDQGNQLCMLVGGQLEQSSRLDVHNVEEVFKPLKSKVAKECVV